MTLPNMRPGLTSREFLRIAGGYEAPALGTSPAGGLDIDNAGNLATDGDFTTKGELDVQSGKINNTTGDLTLDAQNNAADSTIYLRNSDGTYEAHVEVEGDLDIGGDVSADGGVSVGGFLSLGTQEACTISSGAITPTKSYATVSTEGGAGTDDLDTINGGVTGDILILTSTSVGNVVTVKDAVGNVVLNGDFVMAGTWDTLALIKRGSLWLELFRMNR